MQLLLFDRLTKLLEHLTAPRQPLKPSLKEALSTFFNFVNVFRTERRKNYTSRRGTATGLVN